MEKYFNKLEKAIDYIQVIMISVIVASIGMQIVSRTFLNRPLEFPEEVSIFLLIGIVFIGVIVVEKHDSQLRVEVLLQLVPPRVKKLIILASKPLTILLVIAILLGQKQLWPQIINLKTTAAKIPFAWIHAIIIVSCFLWIIVLIYQTIKIIVEEGL